MRIQLLKTRVSRVARLLAAAALCAVMCGAAARAQDEAAPQTDSHLPPILKVGSTAPDFRLPGVDGKVHTLAEYKAAKVLAVIFSCDHCPVAMMYESRIKQLAADYRSKGVAVVVIMGNDPLAERLDELGYTDVGDTFADMKIRAKDHKLDYPYLYDGDTQSVAKKYGPTATPHAFIFDQHRILRYEGRIDNNLREALATKHEARDAIDALLADRQVAVTDTPAVGCSTKWSYKRESVAAETQDNNARPVNLDLADAQALHQLVSSIAPGRMLLVNVWATWCGPCVTEFPALQKMVRTYINRQIDFVTVSINNPDEQKLVLAFLQKQHAFNRNLMFSGNDSADAVKAIGDGWQGGAPFTVLLGPEGKILYSTQGEMDAIAVRRAILRNLPDDYYKGQHDYWNLTY